MSLGPGTRLGPYEILSAIGAGGMGEVYRATDTNLGRLVAIKVLPEAFAQDPERLARFEREAKTLASLSHPNIAIIHGLEKSHGAYALVMELVEGEDLSQRVSRGPIPLDEALPIATQIAEGLAAAHEQGIIHRDLKPANIKVRPDGAVKVLDFGLAKLHEPPGSAQATPGNASISPTITSPTMMTGVGVLLGTAAYMAPEQAKGRPANKRSDMWAFGCVLFEMLTGTPAFRGEDITDTLANVLKTEPDWSRLPREVPPALRALMRGCLQKDSRVRIGDVAAAQFAFAQCRTGSADLLPATPLGPRRSWLIWAVGGMLVLTAAAMVPVTVAHLRETAASAEVVRFTIAPPDDAVFTGGDAYSPAPAVAPDGHLVVFRAQRRDEPDLLWIRTLDSVDARPLRGTENGNFPFWSPDSRYVGFFAAGKLKKVDVSTGTVQTLCDAPAGEGGTWSANDVIVFAATDISGLSRVSASGGQPQAVTELDKSASPPQTSHRQPEFLPDGQRFLFRVQPGNEIHLASLDSKNSRKVLNAESRVSYASPGYLLFVQQGTLLAQPFDATIGETVGEAIPIAEQVRWNVQNGRAGFSVSNTGVLVYRGGFQAQTRITSVDRGGKLLESIGPPGDYRHLDLSPDGTRVIVHLHSDTAGGGGLWLVDVLRRTTSRFTFGSSHEGSAHWSRDGSHVVFTSNRGAVGDLYRKLATGVGSEELLLSTGIEKHETAITSDGRVLMYATVDAKTRTDLWVLPLDGDRRPMPYLTGPYDEDQGQFSPDGKWVAYVTNETGRDEVYVQPFPATGGKWQVSTGGGVQPRWRADGKELYYLDGGAQTTVRVVDVHSNGSRFEAGVPKALFVAPLARVAVALGVGTTFSSYGITENAQRFVLLTQAAEDATAPMTTVLNWTAALNK